jgi:YD repeat-containing protein
MLLGLRLCVVAIILAFVSSPAYAQSYQYDERGRLIRATYSDCSTIRYFYDASGNRTERIVLTGDGSCSGNLAPIAADDVITMAPGEVRLFDLLAAHSSGNADADPDGDPVRIVSVEQGSIPITSAGELGVQLQDDRSQVQITASDETGSYDFSYRIEDAFGLTDEALVLVEVATDPSGPADNPSGPDDCPPLLLSDSVAAVKRDALAVFHTVEAQDQIRSLLSGCVLTDEQENSLSYAIADGGVLSGFLNLDETNGELSLVQSVSEALIGDYDVVEVTILVEDSDSNLLEYALQIMVLPINRSETVIARNNHRDIWVGDSVKFDVTFDDFDGIGEGLTLQSVRILSGAGAAGIDAASNKIRFNAPSHAEVTRMRYCVQNTINVEDCAFFTVTTQDPDEMPPVAQSDEFEFLLGESQYVLNVLENDFSYSNSALSIIDVNELHDFNVSISADGKSLILDNVSSIGEFRFLYTIQDEESRQASSEVDIEFKERTIQANADFFGMRPGRTRTFAPLENDYNPAGLDLYLTDVNAVSALCIEDGFPELCDASDFITNLSHGAEEFSISVNSAVGLAQLSLNYVVSDGVRIETGVISVVVGDSYNDPPVAVLDEISMLPDTDYYINVVANDYDLNGDSIRILDFESLNDCAGAERASETQIFVQASNSECSVDFNYSILDRHGGETVATLRVNVLAADVEPPVARRDTFPYALNVPQTVSVLDNDVDGNGSGLELLSVYGVNVRCFYFTEDFFLENVDCATYDVEIETSGNDVIFEMRSSQYPDMVSFYYEIKDGLGLRSTASVSAYAQ